MAQVGHQTTSNLSIYTMHNKTKNPRPPSVSKVPKISIPNPREHLGRERERERERGERGYPDPWERRRRRRVGQRGGSSGWSNNERRRRWWT
jgi:hypothetical protein